MLAVIYYHSSEKAQAEEFVKTLKDNGVFVVSAESQKYASVACTGCLEASSCDKYDEEDGWCFLDEDNNPFTPSEFIQEKERFNADGEKIAYVPIHPFADKEGFIAEKRLVMEYYINEMIKLENMDPDLEIMIWDPNRNMYLLNPNASVEVINGDEENLAIGNLRVVSAEVKDDIENLYVYHPGTSSVQ